MWGIHTWMYLKFNQLAVPQIFTEHLLCRHSFVHWRCNSAQNHRGICVPLKEIASKQM